MSDNTSNNPKFPHIAVKLTGRDGNAFAIMGTVKQAMTRGGCTQDDIDEYMEESMSGDYDNLLRVARRTVQVS